MAYFEQGVLNHKRTSFRRHEVVRFSDLSMMRSGNMPCAVCVMILVFVTIGCKPGQPANQATQEATKPQAGQNENSGQEIHQETHEDDESDSIEEDPPFSILDIGRFYRRLTANDLLTPTQVRLDEHGRWDALSHGKSAGILKTEVDGWNQATQEELSAGKFVAVVFDEPVDAKTLELIANAPGLKLLYIRRFMPVEIDISILNNAKELKCLSFQAAAFAGTGQIPRLNLPGLETLAVWQAASDSSIRELPDFPRLLCFQAAGGHITDEGVKVICQKYPNLRYLHLALNGNITKGSIVHLATLKNLGYLQIGGTTLGRRSFSSGAEDIAELKRLLPNCRIDCGQ